MDCRTQYAIDNHCPACVFYGFGWLRTDVYDLFAEAVYLFEPIFPVCSQENPVAQLRAGQAPSLSELRLHVGSIGIGIVLSMIRLIMGIYAFSFVHFLPDLAPQICLQVLR
jgi:hypothetical protein